MLNDLFLFALTFLGWLSTHQHDPGDGFNCSPNGGVLFADEAEDDGMQDSHL
jgi:hypothetical protein